MSEIVLATEPEYEKGKETFRAAEGLEVQPAPEDEASLSQAALASDCRAVIVGGTQYLGPLYEALGRTGEAGQKPKDVNASSPAPRAIIARFGVGHDGVDKAKARRHRVIVANTPGVLNVSVAEHVLWLIGALARRIPAFDARLRAGRFDALPGDEISGKALGVIGFGAIGRCVARMAHRAFGMRILAVDCRTGADLERSEGRPMDEIQSAYGLEVYTDDAHRVLRQADVVSLHLPATDETRHFINADRLALMKPGAFLVNTARGAVLDEMALYDALTGGRLAGAALDVFETEPYRPVAPDKDLRTLDNVVLTPHVSSNTRESNRRMARACLENIANFFAGRLEKVTRVE